MHEPEAIERILRCVAELATRERRADAGRALATLFGAEELIVFVRDARIGQSLPPPGFPRTLRSGREWRDLVERAVRDGFAASDSACALGLPDGTALALFGRAAPAEELEPVRTLLPLLGALFRSEAAAELAEADSRIAREASAQNASLAAKLDVMRGELQRAVAVAESAARARDEFLATVSHELRTPLTSIVGWVQLLRDENIRLDLDEALDTIERSARAQSRLIEDILDFARINAGKLRLDVRPMELVDIITAATDIVRPAADAKGVQLDCVVDPNAGVVSGDPDRLQQVVWNLLSNAVKFTPRGGRVQVRLGRVSSSAELTVSDTGEGIPADFLPHVFDRFSQADSSSTRQHSGLGLGLGIVRHLVELHGGTVEAWSAGRGQGATFIVRLPLLVALQRAAPETSAPRDGDPFADLTGIDVLIVEDNEDARKILTTILQRAGATVSAVESAARGLERIHAQRPHLVISDIEMPGEDGYTFIRKLREQESPQRLPAIALTAYARSVDRVRALAAGFQMHIGKPVEPAELVAAVKSLVAARS